MNIYPVLTKMMAVLTLVVLVMVVYLLWARPYQLGWGATDAEVNRVMPGDELDSDPSFLATRAITIDGLWMTSGLGSSRWDTNAPDFMDTIFCCTEASG